MKISIRRPLVAVWTIFAFTTEGALEDCFFLGFLMGRNVVLPFQRSLIWSVSFMFVPPCFGNRLSVSLRVTLHQNGVTLKKKIHQNGEFFLPSFSGLWENQNRKRRPPALG
jgi:hypothetical protein